MPITEVPTPTGAGGTLFQCSAVNGGIVMMHRGDEGAAWAEGGDAGADFVNSAVFLGAPEGRANAAAVLVLCDITR
jgi:hypothetical protein